MSTPAEKLGGLVKERRESLGIYVVMDAAARAGVSRETWANVENGAPARSATYRKIEDALEWEHGSCDAILDGGEPTVRQANNNVPTAVAEVDMEDLRRLREALVAALDRIDEMQRDADHRETG